MDECLHSSPGECFLRSVVSSSVPKPALPSTSVSAFRGCPPVLSVSCLVWLQWMMMALVMNGWSEGRSTHLHYHKGDVRLVLKLDVYVRF